MERFIKIAIIATCTILGWQGGGYLLVQALSHFVLPHMAHGNGFGALFMFGFNLGELVGISGTVGLIGGLWSGVTLARRYRPAARPPRIAVSIVAV